MKEYKAAVAICFLLLINTFSHGMDRQIRKYDFKNCAYPDPKHCDFPKHIESITKSKANGISVTVLKDGVSKYSDDSSGRSGLYFQKVLFGDLNNDSIEEAIVELQDYGGGNTSYTTVYIFTLRNGAPKLQWYACYEQGKTVELVNNQLEIEAPEWRAQDPSCCPKYMTTYKVFHSHGKYTTLRIARVVLQQDHLQ